MFIHWRIHSVELKDERVIIIYGEWNQRKKISIKLRIKWKKNGNKSVSIFSSVKMVTQTDEKSWRIKKIVYWLIKVPFYWMRKIFEWKEQINKWLKSETWRSAFKIRHNKMFFFLENPWRCSRRCRRTRPPPKFII